MMRRKFTIAAIIAIATPVLLIMPWAWDGTDFAWIFYAMLPSLIGVIVGGFIHTRIRESCSGGILSFFLASMVNWVAALIVLPNDGPGDAYPAAIFAFLVYSAISGIVGFIFGTGLGQSWPSRRQQ